MEYENFWEELITILCQNNYMYIIFYVMSFFGFVISFTRPSHSEEPSRNSKENGLFCSIFLFVITTGMIVYDLVA